MQRRMRIVAAALAVGLMALGCATRGKGACPKGAQGKIDVTGVWEMDDSRRPALTSVLKLEQQGDQITGTLESPKETAKITGTVFVNAVRLNLEAKKGHATFNGSIDGDTMKGTWTGTEGKGPWTAKRVKTE